MNKRHAFTLMEVLVAAVIFTIAVAGVFSSIAVVKTYSNPTLPSALGAARCGQQFLETLRSEVSALKWTDNTNILFAPTGGAVTRTLTQPETVPYNQCFIGAVTYGIRYTVTDAGNNKARRVDVVVSW